MLAPSARRPNAADFLPSIRGLRRDNTSPDQNTVLWRGAIVAQSAEVTCKYCGRDRGNVGDHPTIQDCLDALVKETERLKREFVTFLERSDEEFNHRSEFHARLLPNPE